jgi:solute carrier family 5 (sodium-coupled monocarboxylate transporter), member 8/12
MNVNEFKQSLRRFELVDYAVFIGMLSLCSVVGLYFGYQDLVRRKKRLVNDSEALDYLMGGRRMNVFPIAMSLIASLVSGVLLLGEPSYLRLQLTKNLSI